MKRILIILVTVISLQANSQIDSTQIPQTITLKAKHLEFIKACISTNDIPDRVNLFNSIASQLDTTDNPNQNITVTVSSGLVVDVFDAMGQQSEYYSNAMNDSIQYALMPQLTNQWLINTLYQKHINNDNETERRRKQGFQYFKDIKQ